MEVIHNGKTSIINAIGTIGQFISKPVTEYKILERLKKIEKKDDEEEILKNILESVQSGIDFEVQNVRRLNEDSKIMIEMYILDDNEALSGYYEYEIIFNGISKSIISEKLLYRKKYKSKPIEIINLKEHTESQVGYIVKYYNNLMDLNKNENDNITNKYSYCKCLYDHYIKDSEIIRTDNEDNNFISLDIVKWYQEDKDLLKNIINIIDPRIIDVKTDKNSDNYDLFFIFKDNCRLSYNKLSTGTKRFLKFVKNIINIMKENGILVIDEIEQNLNRELVELVIRIFAEIKDSKSQLIFTTHTPSLFDINGTDDTKIFRQDNIYILNFKEQMIAINKLMDIKIDGQRIKNDAVVSNLYKKHKISFHPDCESINKVISIINKS